ncbi:hypothetical protein [Cetobacterium somerae]
MSNTKIGARNLSNKELEVLLPNWKDIFSEIVKIRDSSVRKDEEDQILKEEPEFDKHHNNIFSILGERGAGKTSVQLSLKYRLMEYYKNEEEYKNDTILQLIVPQDMEENSSTIGWIIAYFSNLVEKIEEDFKENRQLFYYEKNCKTNPVLTKFKELKKSFFIRSESYKNSINSDNSITEYIERNGEVIKEDINLSKKFKEFIDEYIKYKKNVNKSNASEPLIHIFFDDVDISNKKCLMVLETIMRYLSHANIVVFVAGDYLTFKETITLKYLKDDGLLYKDLLNETFEKCTALEVRQTLAYDYLKKVLSPALRYELKKYNLDEKKDFKYGKLDDDKFKLKNLIEEKLGNNFNNIYYELLDSKPRGLMNIYYFLESAKKYQELDEKNKNLFIKRILNIIIDSSSILNTEKESIEELIEVQDKKVRVNFEKFSFKDFSEKNLLKLYLMVFIDELIDENQTIYEKEILNYFVEYFKTNLNLASISYSSKEMYDIFLTKSDLIKNIELFHLIKKELGNRKIEESDFISAYVQSLTSILQEQPIPDYFCENLIYNKEKIKRIIEKLQNSNKIEENQVRKEMELIFQNLCLLDDIRGIIEEPLNTNLDEWKKIYGGIKSKNNYELLLKKSTRCLDSNFKEPVLSSMNITDTSLIEKLKNMRKDITEVLGALSFLISESDEKLKEIIRLETEWKGLFLRKNINIDEQREKREKRKKIIVELKKEYSSSLGEADFVELSKIILEGLFIKFKNHILKLDEELQNLEIVLESDSMEAVEKQIKEIEERIRSEEGNLKRVMTIHEIVNKLDFLKIHYTVLNEISKYNEINLNVELNSSFIKIRVGYIEIYEKELNHYLYESLFKSKPSKEISQMLDEIDERIFELENGLILSKEILSIKDEVILNIIKESAYSRLLNLNNYINPMKFLKLSKDSTKNIRGLSLNQGRDVINKELIYVQNYILKNINMSREQFMNMEYEEFVSDSNYINLKVYLNLFKMLLKEKMEKSKIKIAGSREEKLKSLEKSLKTKTKLKNLFSESKK